MRTGSKTDTRQASTGVRKTGRTSWLTTQFRVDDFLLGAGLAGTAVAAGLTPNFRPLPRRRPPQHRLLSRAGEARQRRAEPLLTLTATEDAFVAAAVDTLIPADELSPSGSACGVATFIDRQLAGAYGMGARLVSPGAVPEGQAGARLSALPQPARILPRRHRSPQMPGREKPTARSSTGCRKPTASPP